MRYRPWFKPLGVCAIFGTFIYFGPSLRPLFPEGDPGWTHFLTIWFTCCGLSALHCRWCDRRVERDRLLVGVHAHAEDGQDA